MNFQVYLLEGLVQWNEAHGVAAVEGGRREDICYGGQMQQYINVLSEQLLGHKMLEDFTSPGEYTGIVFMHICHIQVEAVFHQCVVKTFALYMVITLCISTGELIGVEYLYSQTNRAFEILTLQMGFSRKTCRVIWMGMKGSRKLMSPLSLWTSLVIPCSPFTSKQ